MNIENKQSDRENSIPVKAGWSRKLVIGAAATVVVVGATAAAFAGMGDGPGHWRGKFMRGFMEYRMEQALTDVDASAEQKEKLKTLLQTTMKEIRPERGEHRQMRQEVIDLLKAPTIDRDAIETLRVKHVAELDAKSKIVAKAVADAAEILTPEQRAKLVDEFGDFGPDRD